MGGLSRRNTTLEQRRAESPVIVVDGGHSLMPRGRKLDNPEPADFEQRKSKAELIAKGWAIGGIDAIVLGSVDWTLGTEFVHEIVGKYELPVLAANLTCDGEKPYPGSKVVQRGNRSMGIVGVAEGPVDGCTVSDPAAAVQEELAALGDVDVSLLLLPYLQIGHTADVLSSDDSGFDLVIDARGRHSASGPERLGGAWALGAGARGKMLGIVGLQWVDGADGWSLESQANHLIDRIERHEKRLKAAEERLTRETAKVRIAHVQRQIDAYTAQLTTMREQLEAAQQVGAHTNKIRTEEVPLTADVPDHAETLAAVQATLATFVDPMGDGGMVKHHLQPRVAPEGSPYAGGQACIGCHPTQHAQWSTTTHAHAWQTLVEQNRHLDYDCFGCHATGVDMAAGTANPAEVGGLRDVQCEACHGAARAHVEAPVEVKPVRDPEPASCTVCHDGERDEGRFDYATYRPKVVHTPAE